MVPESIQYRCEVTGVIKAQMAVDSITHRSSCIRSVERLDCNLECDQS